MSKAQTQPDDEKEAAIKQIYTHAPTIAAHLSTFSGMVSSVSLTDEDEISVIAESEYLLSKLLQNCRSDDYAPYNVGDWKGQTRLLFQPVRDDYYGDSDQ